MCLTMNVSPASKYAIIGAIVLAAVVWGVVFLWAHHQYAVGISSGGLWKLATVLAFIGAACGILIYRIKTAMKVR